MVNGLLGRFLLPKFENKPLLVPIIYRPDKRVSMRNIIRITTIILFLLVLTASDADAALFNWQNISILGKLTSIEPESKWTFYNVANKSADTTINKKTVLFKEDEYENFRVVKTYTVRATAYSSTVDQTDSTPFITASNTYVRDGIIAANFLPFGTTVRIPEIYGNKLFVVEDRMHQRYWYNVDIWFPEREMAKEFGARKVRIEVVTNTLVN